MTNPDQLNCCPLCGASYSNGEDCEQRFHQFLGLEFTDPAYGVVHFYTVASYMIQHQRYSDQGNLWIQEMILSAIDRQMNFRQIRDQAETAVGDRLQKGRIIREKNAPRLEKIVWSTTISDVAEVMDDATAYCNAVLLWARKTAEEMHVWTGRRPGE